MSGALPARLERRRGAAQARAAAPRATAVKEAPMNRCAASRRSAPRPCRPRAASPLGAALAAAALAAATLGPLGAAPACARLLVPMDDAQTDHLKAYGLTYWVLGRGQKAEWLLNYRGGSFLLADDPATQREADLRGVTTEPMNGGAEAAMRAESADNNMESIALEKAPKVAVYIPPNTPPWDDAVTLALRYADIPYATVWDEEVL